MAYGRRREALRGAEEQTFDILAEVMTSEEWGKLLRAPLEHAAAKGKRDIAQKLVGAGAEIGNALHAATRGGNQEIVNNLLENGASVATKENDGLTPLHVAARAGATEMVQLLLLKGADKDALDDDERTPLYLAVLHGKVGAALALLAAGANVSLRCGRVSESVLHAAAERGRFDIMTALIERGADVNAFDDEKYTPLHSAALCNQADAIDMLMEAGANIGARGQFGFTPLHHAADEPALEALLALLTHVADVNAQDNRQCTPLHCAATMAGLEGVAMVVDSLLRAGADETILNEEGKAAADVIGCFVQEEEQLGEDADRVRELLANAPADRAWRRRGYLVLCRTFPERIKQMQHISIANAGAARSTRNSAKLRRAETGNCTGTAGVGIADGQAGGDWAVVVARVLGLHEEGIFRAVVRYL